MTTHYLHLHPEPFALVQSGKKTIENRLFDEKRQTYQIGDELVFSNRGNETEKIFTKIVDFHKAKTFEELFSNEKVVAQLSTRSLDVLLHGVGQYYSLEDQKKYGVVGIEFVVR